MPTRIEAAGREELRIRGASETLELVEAEGADASSKPKRFTMVAYTGAAMQVGFGWPVVVDLEGMSVPSESRPILRSHDPDRILGHTERVDKSAQRLKVSGVLSGVGDDVDHVVATAKNGFPWQASIGASVGRLEYVDRGEKVKVNGRTFDGPIYVARSTVLGEISFVPIGADGATSATVAAAQGGTAMEWEAWVKAKGFDPATLTPESKTFLEAAFAAEKEPKAKDKPKEPAANPPEPLSAAGQIEDYRKAIVAEQLRTLAIDRVCAQNDNPMIWVGANGEISYSGDPGSAVPLKAHAVATGMDEKTATIHALRAGRHNSPAPNVSVGRAAPLRGEVLEAALCVSRGLPNVEKHYKPETLEAAHKNYRNLGLQQLIMLAASANGYGASPGERIHNGNIRDVLGHAFRLKAASTVSLSGILGNVANKELLAGYVEEDQSWREIAAVKSVSNFHAVTSYRMLDDMEYEEVGPDGKIKHGSVDQESYTRQAKTYAKMFALTRRDIVNDDLQAFDDLRNRIGRGSAQKFNNVFWTEFLSDASTFWTTARGNYITGATTTLLTDGVGLALAVKAFRQMKSPSTKGSANDSGKRIGGRPEILLVPPELEYAADNLFMGEKLNVGSGPGDINVYRNKYKPLVSPWLSDTNFTGYSTTAWYLLRSPAIAPAVVVSFLNGMQTPTVESAEADFDTLGVQFRGFHDFGVDQAEYLCGVKSKGAA